LAVEVSIWIIQGTLLVLAFVFFLMALHVRDLIRAIASFAAGSAFVAAAMFVLGAPFAAVLELTVGAGLVAVLFIVAITLVGGRERAEEAGA